MQPQQKNPIGKFRKKRDVALPPPPATFFRLCPKGTGAEVGKALRDMIRAVDVHIWGRGKFDAMLRQAFMRARACVGSSPREEANALHALLASVSLWMMHPDRWKYQLYPKELLPPYHFGMKILGLGRDERFDVNEDVHGSDR